MPVAAAGAILSAADLMRQAGVQFPPHSDGHVLYPHQIPPSEFQRYEKDIWLLKGGRGSGKTEAGAKATLEYLRTATGTRPRVGIGAPTNDDCRFTCAEGETGLITLAESGEFPVYNRSTLEARHREGGIVRFIGSEHADRWNGPQWSRLWWDELSLCNKDAWDMSMFGLRLGPHPQCIATTTPKNRAFIKDLYTDPAVIVTHGTTYDNPNLAKVVLKRLEAKYGGTRLGRQELMGEDVGDIEGALWQSDWIDSNRVSPQKAQSLVLPHMVVAVDPAGAHGEQNDQTAVAAAALADNGEFYVFDVYGVRLSPYGWAQRAIDSYDQWQADMALGEINNGGEMVEYTLRTVRPNMNIKTIHASRGKTVRAEPIAALYQQGKVHHVGVFLEAEEQMCSFPVASEHDDMVDALVYALTELAERTGFGIEAGAPVEVGRRSVWRS